jgi:hypothetical protein
VLTLPLATGGCALGVPKMQKFGETPTQEWVRETNLIQHVKCELHRSVQLVLAHDAEAKVDPALDASWLRDWGAKISLKVVIDEKLSSAPGVSFNNPMRNVIKTFPKGGNVTTAQSQSTALGATFSSSATRTETIGFFYPFKELLAEREITEPCSKADGMLIEGDLGIGDFLQGKVLPTQVPGTLSHKPGSSPYDVMTYQVSFVVSAAGTANPSWKLVYLSVNPTGPLISGSRSRTNDLTLTLGPVKVDDKGKIEAAEALRDQHLANLIGNAVAESIQAKP